MSVINEAVLAAPDIPSRQRFLKEDLFDALKWLFVGAVTWEASQSQSLRCANQDALGMFTSLTQARALYEFFYGVAKQDDDARARHFASTWNPGETDLYRRFMAARKPANKRLFHLVYNRHIHAGGLRHGEDDHLKNQVLEFAKDLRSLTERFADSVETDFRDGVRQTLQRALQEAELTAGHYGIANPI